VGAADGSEDGPAEGADDGTDEGAAEGPDDGEEDGPDEGSEEGSGDGAGVATTGFLDRTAVGVGAALIIILAIIVLGAGHIIIPLFLQPPFTPPLRPRGDA
jgi:hypothetical protein